MIKKISKNIFQLLLIISIIYSYLFSPLVVNAKQANTIQELREQLADLKNQKNQKENEKAQTQDEIKANKNRISASYNAKESIANQVEDTKNKIIESQNEIDKTGKDIDNILKYYQLTTNSNEYMEYITGASTTTEMIMRASAVEQISTYYKNKIETLKQLIVDNQKLQVQLSDQNKDLDQKINDYANALDSLSGQLDELTDTADDMNTQIDRLEQQIKYYKSVCNSETQDLSTCVNDPQSFGWLKPLVRGRVTSEFGSRSGSFHYGVDLGGNPEGTAEYATAAGRVAYVMHETSCGGNRVYIYVTVNGQRYTLEYAHMLSINVQLNQFVTTGTVVGTVGGYSTSKSHGGYDSCSGGMHLHYGVATGWYGVDYKTWSQWQAHNVRAPGIPTSGTWWYTR
jgi:murein DD-endopeptidase MepM/ murein hydrolase activator NlpD